MDNRFESQDTHDAMSREASRLLHDYLHRAETVSSAVVSAQKQAELREEMSDHILALAAAHRELGSSPEEAMLAALTQFGKAEQVGQAVAREIGRRPMLLGSSRTVSMIGGIMAAWIALSAANYLLASTELNVVGPAAHLCGIVLGCVTGGVVWKRRYSIPQAAVWNARLWAGAAASSTAAMLLFYCFYSGTPAKFVSLEWLRLAVPVLLQWIAVAGIAGACSGALTGLWSRVVLQSLPDTETLCTIK